MGDKRREELKKRVYGEERTPAGKPAAPDRGFAVPVQTDKYGSQPDWEDLAPVSSYSRKRRKAEEAARLEAEMAEAGKQAEAAGTAAKGGEKGRKRSAAGSSGRKAPEYSSGHSSAALKTVNKKQPRVNRFTRTLSVIYTLLAAIFVFMITKVDVLPGKFYWPLVIAILLVTVFTVPSMFSKYGKKGRRILASLLALLFICIFALGSFYIYKTVQTLNSMYGGDEIITEDYHILVVQDSEYIPEPEPVPETKPTLGERIISILVAENTEPEEAEDNSETAAFDNIADVKDLLKDAEVGTYMIADKKYQEAKAAIFRACSVKYSYEKDADALMAALKKGTYDFILVSDAIYLSMKEEDDTFTSQTDILYTARFRITEEKESKSVDVLSESFNVFISGCDYTGNLSAKSRSDVNMVVTVNPSTHEVHITSIPRDYYVTLHSKGKNDKLTHAGVYGISESTATVEDLLGIDINYYVKVNFTTMIKLVDAIGGIDVVSEYDFTTSGMGDVGLNGTHFVKGKNHLTGKQALAFCRERHSFTNGDMQRNRNQQIVLEAILKKVTSSSTILTSYTNILGALDGKIETNMTPDEMTDIVKKQLDEMPSWTITRTNITGKTGWGVCYTGNRNLSIVEQNTQANAEATDRIYSIMNIKELEEQSLPTAEGGA